MSFFECLLRNVCVCVGRPAVKVDDVRLPGTPPGELVIVELERGQHSSATAPVAAGAPHAEWAAVAPVSVPLTLFRDNKGVYRPKLFVLRVRRAGGGADGQARDGQAKSLGAVLTAMAPVDAADFASKTAAPPTTLVLEDAEQVLPALAAAAPEMPSSSSSF